ncbi:MAG TPA: acyl-[ACP]--phospholipid O-acyltransferase [Pirellulales bacterium]|nr:acyl-[ACP]--phospholipid O-acyltransferase [Pirellulales bacterium]
METKSDLGIGSKSFIALLVTQFLGAANDNMIRWLCIGIGKEFVPEEDSAWILSLGLAFFVGPYLVLAAPAGYLADRFSKRKVIVACKAAEIVIMLLAVLAVVLGNQYGATHPRLAVGLLFGVILLMGSQSALFGPSKLGSIPEMLKPEKISSANGILGLVTVVATCVGTAAGNLLYQWTHLSRDTDWWILSLVLVSTAAAGLVASVFITRLQPLNPNMKFPWNAVQRTWQDLSTLAANRAMFRVALGIAFFWSLGSLCNLNIDQFGHDSGLNQGQIIPLLVALVVGVGLGSVLAGVWSGGKVELGILPLGAGGVAFFSILLFTVHGDLFNAEEERWTRMLFWACSWLFLLGVSAGLFDVPLAAYMQHRSAPESRGAILAASNFLTFSGMLCVAGMYNFLRQPDVNGDPLFTARQIFLLGGLGTIPVFIYIIWVIPQASVRFLVWLATHTIYRVRVDGRDNLPKTGGALLVANHVSWLDGVLLLISSSRPMRLMVWAPYSESRWLSWLARTMRVIPISGGLTSTRQALQTAREAVQSGELVCIFPEGRITRSGLLQRFKPGMLKIVEGTPIPVIPVYLDGMWGSMFSYKGDRISDSRPVAWPYPLSISFGTPIQHPEDVREVRRAVEELGTEASFKRSSREMNLAVAFLKQCRSAAGRSKVADSGGADLTGRQLLLKTLVLRRILLRDVLGSEADEKYVGLLLPPSAGAVVTNVATTLCRRIPVNLNYTVSSDVMNSCIKQCEIRHVLTSRKVMEKLDINIDAELIYLEDFKDAATVTDKLAAAIGAYLAPVGVLARRLGVHECDPDDVFTVIFTSGSTGDPKGVMLTTRNIASNVAAIDSVIHLKASDVLVGILPFFHSFGFTITLWTVLTLVPKGIYHFTPLDARQVGKMCKRHGATLLLATPTFLRSYLKRCDPEQFEHIDTVVTGAERLPPELVDAFEKKFGVRPVEGYGATELSPLASVNIPPSRALGDPSEGIRAGSVGRPIPNVMAKIVDPDTDEEIHDDRPGKLLIKGPNVMKGYLNKPDKTAEVLKDGWYLTGDIAKTDDEGFITITGRESRFSKIGGEMVPHVGIEEALARLLASAGGEEDDATLDAVVTAIPDQRKGERLIVLHTQIKQTPSELCKGLQAAGLPAIWIPSPDSFFQVTELPMLGTGKLDLKAIKQMASEMAT